MIIDPADPVLGGEINDTGRRDKLYGGGGDDIFVLQRDARTDLIYNFEDGADRIDLTSFDITYDSLMIRQLSLTEYVVFVRDEVIRITFEEPAPEDIPASGRLLDADDFIFATGAPDPVLQVHLETNSTGTEVQYGTSLPDVFIFQDDGQRDVVRLFEPGKDQIDLTDYSTSYNELTVTERKTGRILVEVPAGESTDKLVLIDVSRQLTMGDITEDMFIF